MAENPTVPSASPDPEPTPPRSSATRLYRERSLTFADLASQDPAMQRALQEAEMAAKYDIEVLLLGESGTGKTLFALAMHNASPRGGPFVEMDVARVPDSIIEGELFGHEKGSFTGAVSDKHGILEMARDGTPFLNEIGNMRPAMQAKILTVLETKRFCPVGGRKEITVDFRIISATNADLEGDLLKNKTFRQDLCYRLGKIPLWLPPLRERKADILPLARRFLYEANDRFRRNIQGFTPECEARILADPWPGNLRGLYSAVFAALVFTKGPLIEVGDLFRDRARHCPPNGDRSDDPQLTLEEVGRRHVLLVLDAQEGSIPRAAEVLGLTRQGLHKMLKRWGIDPEGSASAAVTAR